MVLSKTYYTQLIVLSILCMLTFCISCEKDIDVEFPEHESSLVVEGWIEQGVSPKVLLTLSAPFFIAIDSNNLRDYAVTSAKVTVSTDNLSEVLTLKPNDKYFPPYVYFGTELFGEIGNSYQLKVEYRGTVTIAETSIPELVEPDSVWFEPVPEQDSLGLLWFQLSDNPDTRDFYRTQTKRLGKDNRFISTFTSVFDDLAFNGETITISLSRGSTSLLDIDNNRFFSLGDTIILRFCTIDKDHYEFWNTLQGQIISSANPFAASNANVQSNIYNGIGVWGGYATSYDTVIAK